MEAAQGTRRPDRGGGSTERRTSGPDQRSRRDLLGHKHLATTQKYNRSRVTLDRHCSYQVAAQIAAARR
ncbi:site-specific recombinase XerC [Kribbella aluminosa]|uniref:Site-specific recombinase XerC n=1 Tax=Kribbella aluminosa TaxID=416017 RepID=A0ABS4UJI9_9ACTN|nr:hypothetical protein [Kribbella aluminosa]MBP2351811.1 site-specific recombinase XerC [Kribbella aluminosa]